jgi:C-terminal processing protease CtpA/Prc
LSERTSGRTRGLRRADRHSRRLDHDRRSDAGGPALDAGIRAGDRIVEVNGAELRGVTVEAAQKALRGAPGSVVRVTIERPGVTTPLSSR